MKTEFIVANNTYLELAMKAAEKYLHDFVNREKIQIKNISHSIYQSNDRTYTVTILVVY